MKKNKKAASPVKNIGTPHTKAKQGGLYSPERQPYSELTNLFKRGLIVRFDGDRSRTLLLDEKNVCLINGKAISLGAAVRWFAEEWPKHTDANWGDDPFMARFFKLIADQLEPAGVLVAGIPDAELLGNIASHEGVTLTMPITLPPNVWMDMFVGSMKLKKPLVEVLSEGLVTEDLVNDCFVNTTGG